MKTSCVKIRLRPGCVEKARAWAREINRRAEEALATLRDESVSVESVFLDSTANGDFLIYYLRAENLEHAGETAALSAHPIDFYHKQFKSSCWMDSKELEQLMDLSIDQEMHNQEIKIVHARIRE